MAESPAVQIANTPLLFPSARLQQQQKFSKAICLIASKHAPVSARSGDKDQTDRIAVFVGIWPCNTRNCHGYVGRTSLDTAHCHGLGYRGAHRSMLGDHLDRYADGKGFAFLRVGDKATVEDLSRALGLCESAGQALPPYTI